MDPIRILMDEHRKIEQALDALDGFAGTLVESRGGEREALKPFVRFIRRYADQIHHGKEEDILFQALEEMGMPRSMGPLAVMYAEHDQGRMYVGALHEVAEGSGAVLEPERNRAANAARGFSVLLRAHIQKEDQVLYPMARQTLPPPVMKAIAERFEAFQTKDAPEAERHELEAVAAELHARWVEAE